MAIACLGLSHHTAPVDVRERHAFPPARMAEALVALRDYPLVREAAMLSTCNRIEIYAELDAPDGMVQLKEFLVNFRHGAIPYDIEPYLYTLHADEAIAHFFRVATGVDSLMIGEAEILGQVKEAYAQAHRAGSVGPALHRLFREALAAGKAARSQTSIGRDSVSVATAAVELAAQHVGAIAGKSVLLVGAGRMGEAAAKRLKHDGAARLTVVSRTRERARQLVEQLGAGDAVDLAGLPSALTAADVVVTATGSTRFVLTPANVSAAMLARPARPMFIVDIAVPRDTDPACRLIPGVRIADIDQLSRVVDVTIEHRRESIPHVERIVSDHVGRYVHWYRSRVAIPAIAHLANKAERIRETEIDRLFGRCPQLSARERSLITGSTLTIISKLLHSAIAHIRERALDDRDAVLAEVRLLDEMFELHLGDRDGAA